MTTFYIARHGQTENNKIMKFSGWIDTPLTDDGVKNALSSGAKLLNVTFDEVYASDLGRAFITAYLILNTAGQSTEIKLAKDLREINYGDYANQPYSVYPVISAQENTNFVVPGGESLAQMQHRVLNFIDIVSRDNINKTILLAAHDGTINAVYASYTSKPIGIVDSESQNAHDFVGKFIYKNEQIISFEEV